MNIHPFADKFPMMPSEELDSLAADIQKNGLILPIITYHGEVIDGRNRLRACELAGAEPHFREWDGGTDQSPTGLILSLNVKRRHLNSSQKAAIAVEALPFFEAEAAARQKATLKQFASAQDAVRQQIDERSSQPRDYKQENANTAEAQAAKAAGTNRQYVHIAKEMKEEDPERFERVRQGAETISQYRGERLIGVRRGMKQKKRKKPKPRLRSVLIGEKANQRMHDRAIKCAEKGRPLSYPEIASTTELALSYMDEFVTNCQLIPWVKVEASLPERKRQLKDDKYDREYLYQFVIDEGLKAICEDRAPRPAQGGVSVLQRVIALHKEIARRREELQGRTRATRFNPESVAKGELVHVLDYIQDQLDLIVNPKLAIMEASAS